MEPTGVRQRRYTQLCQIIMNQEPNEIRMNQNMLPPSSTFTTYECILPYTFLGLQVTFCNGEWSDWNRSIISPVPTAELGIGLGNEEKRTESAMCRS